VTDSVNDDKAIPPIYRVNHSPIAYTQAEVTVPFSVQWFWHNIVKIARQPFQTLPNPSSNLSIKFFHIVKGFIHPANLPRPLIFLQDFLRLRFSNRFMASSCGIGFLPSANAAVVCLNLSFTQSCNSSPSSGSPKKS
jgi:hypothetical protein